MTDDLVGESTAVNDGLDVLLLEDNADEAALIERIVRSREFTESPGQDATVIGQWYHASTLEAAIDVLDRRSVDVVLSDLMLPDSRGEDTVAALVDHAPHVPIIAFTSNDEEIAGSQTIEAGAEDYHVKGSIDSELVKRSIRHAVQRKRQQLELIESNSQLSLLNRIIGHDIQREMSVATGWVDELEGVSEADEIVEPLTDSLANVVRLADTTADVAAVVERETSYTLEARSIDLVVQTEIDRFVSDNPQVDVCFDGTDDDVSVLATPMLGSAFEHLFDVTIAVHGDEPIRPRVEIDVDDRHVTVSLSGEGVSLTEAQRAYLEGRDSAAESANRLRSGLYLAVTVVESLGGTISAAPGTRISVTLDRPATPDE